MKPPVPIKIYLQALGGKFLGPNAYLNTGIKMSLHYSRGTVPVTYSLTDINDGIIGTDFNTGSTSFAPILTMPANKSGNPQVNYLSAGIIPGTPSTNTVVGTTSVFLPEVIEVAELTVHIPTPTKSDLIIKQPITLDPQQVNYTIHVIVPGLLVKENTTVVVPANTISVFVEMMCGCQVSTGKPTSFWTPSDFLVTARIKFKDGSPTGIVKLELDPVVNGSLFTATVSNFHNIGSIQFTANQASTGNYGALRLDY